MTGGGARLPGETPAVPGLTGRHASGILAKTVQTGAEFLRSLAVPYTYDPRRNTYVLFGLLWGLPIPVFSIGLDCWLTNGASSGNLLAEGCRAVLDRPLHLFFLAHPFLFATIFGALGTMRHDRDRAIGHLIVELEDRIRELDAANEKLKELDRLKSNFLANVSHELRTPLVSMMGYAEMLLDGRLGPVADAQREAVATVLHNAEKQHRLISDLLNFTRFEAQPRLDVRPFALREVALRTAESFRPLLAEKGVTLGVPPDTCDGRVLGDVERIEQVLSNLVSNSLKFTPAGGRIGIAWEPGKGRAVRVSVWDEGRGVAPEERARLFDRFYTSQSPSSSRMGGIGLGLSIVRDILAAHGSAVDVQSRPQGGTVVSFELPQANGELPPGLARLRDGPAIPAAAGPAAVAESAGTGGSVPPASGTPKPVRPETAGGRA